MTEAEILELDGKEYKGGIITVYPDEPSVKWTKGCEYILAGGRDLGLVAAMEFIESNISEDE